MPNWSLIYIDRRSDGLGVRRWIILNKSVLGCACLLVMQTSFWKRVISRKCQNKEGSWCSRRVRKGHEIRVHRTIRGGCKDYESRMIVELEK